jgi:hypothetical protein
MPTLAEAIEPEVLPRIAEEGDLHIREGRFQRWLSLVAGLSSLLSGLEVTYEHYRGSYSRRIMYTPVILSAALFAAGIGGFRSRRVARTLLPAISILTLADSATGFYFHIRGIQRKPGGWRIPVMNVAMGPPLFAPVLFGIAAYLGVVAAFLRRGGEKGERGIPKPAELRHWGRRVAGGHERISRLQDIREGRFQKQMAVAAAVSSFLSGFEALYSHYKNNFRYKAQWSPLVISPLLTAAGLGTVKSVRVAHTWLPGISAAAMINGGIGFGYHARGVLRRPGGLRMPLYNVMYGPPIFAPLLFAASGFLGLLASLLRRRP